MLRKKLCVSAILDETSENKLVEIEKALGRKEFAAHITLAVYESCDAEALCAWTTEFVGRNHAIDVSYSGIGITDRLFIYAIPRQSIELSMMYRDFHEKFDEFCTVYTSLKNGHWTPHTALGRFSLENVDTATKMFKEIRGRIIGLKVVDCTDDVYKIISKCFFDE